jgi:hypothetical protein
MSEILKTQLELSVKELEGGKSPLEDIDLQTLEIWFDRINNKLLNGLPQAITEDDIKPIVEVLIHKRTQFIMEQSAIKPSKAKREPKAKAKTKSSNIIFEALDFDLDLDDL